MSRLCIAQKRGLLLIAIYDILSVRSREAPEKAKTTGGQRDEVDSRRFGIHRNP